MKGIALMLAMLLACPPSVAAAGEKPRGNKAVIGHDGQKYQGTLLAIGSETLVLKEKKSGRILGFAAAEVDQVTVRRSKSNTDGLGVLAWPAVFLGSIIVAGLPLAVPVAAGAGILDSVSGWKKFELSKMNPAQKDAAWETLKKYALFADQLPDELSGQLDVVAKRPIAH